MARNVGIEARRVAGAITSMRIDELISNLAVGIAVGQSELDEACMKIAQFMGEAKIAFGKRAGTEEPDELSLIELGFTPNFYQFVDTILELKIAVQSTFEQTQETTYSTENSFDSARNAQSEYETTGAKSASYGYGYAYGPAYNRTGSVRGYYYNSGETDRSGSSSSESKSVRVTSVDARYASTYSYAVEASSSIKTKILPIPVPPVFEERIRALVNEARSREQFERALFEAKNVLPAIIGNLHAFGGTTAFPSEDHGAGVDFLKWTIDDNSRGSVTFALAQTLDTARDALITEYNNMTTELWAVVDSVADRRTADSHMQSISTGVTNWLNAFVDDNGNKKLSDRVSNDMLNGYMQSIITGIVALRDHLRTLLDGLPKASTESATP